MSERSLSCFIVLGVWMATFGTSHAADLALPAKVDFNRDIRPILSENCYQCHGPDKNVRKADLRLDTPEGARVVVAGKPMESELYLRLTATDKKKMPQAKSGKSLTPRQIALVKKWIEQGGDWKGHWAYLKPVRPELPAAAPAFVKNQIDRFILAKLQESNLQPSAEADRRTLLRRLSFDLTGLPPTRAEVEAFVKDRDGDAYEKVVNRLLSSPHYGERMAMYWLDLVRFADTIGYHSDNPMHVAPYRDYVIRAFNDNMRFDRFTMEQVAGDLMPQATVQQKVASCYNRLLQTTEEGGAQAKEYEAKYAADRVRNVSSVWLGATMGCCQCHHHKFDPFTMKDFYRLAAFFADIQEAAVGRREPGMPLMNDQQAAELKRLDSAVADLKKKLDAATAKLANAQIEWEKQQTAKPDLKLPPAIKDVLALPAKDRSDKQKKQLADHYRGLDTTLKPIRDELTQAEKRRNEYVDALPHSLIAMAGPPRTVRIQPRGNWLDESGEVVTPGVPASLPQPESKKPRLSRLDLAQWLVARDNPLTARVFVNRLWKIFFGQGLAKTLEDLGSQGEWPTHPELLDWLAVEFMDSGWDVKHLVKLLVMSGTYRQSSQPTQEMKERDPYNRLYARQSRYRLDAEMVRDNALAVSGLLSPQIGGPSVKPYQPPGYWAALNFPPREWKNDSGAKLYRRGMYTHWQRSFLHPSLLAFDAPSREECAVERARSNIPQQALVLLNDPTYVEAARVFAVRILMEGGPSVGDRLTWAYETVLSRPPREEEKAVLSELVARHTTQFAADKPAAQKLLGTGAYPSPKDVDPAEAAPWTMVARVLLNLHETITRN